MDYLGQQPKKEMWLQNFHWDYVFRLAVVAWIVYAWFQPGFVEYTATGGIKSFFSVFVVVSLLCFPLPRFFEPFWRLFLWNTVKSQYRPAHTLKVLVRAAEINRCQPHTNAVFVADHDRFLQEAIGIYNESFMSSGHLGEVLERRWHSNFLYDAGLAHQTRIMAQLAVIAGLTPLLWPLIEGGTGQMGFVYSAGSVCAGIAMAYLVLFPLGQQLWQRAEKLKTKNQLIVHGIKLLAQKTHPVALGENLNSVLPPHERVAWSDILAEIKEATA